MPPDAACPIRQRTDMNPVTSISPDNRESGKLCQRFTVGALIFSMGILNLADAEAMPANELTFLNSSAMARTINVANNPYAIQLKLSKQRPNRTRLPQIDLFKHYRLYVTTININQQRWYQLRLGFFPNLALARSANRELQDSFPGSWIVKIPVQERKRSAKLALAPTHLSPTIEAGVLIPLSHKELAQMMEEARRAMAEGRLSHAIALYTKILRYPKHPYRQDALEYLGVARERRGQLAHAKAIYEKYLRLYPQGEDAKRIKQRLEAIITARDVPRKKTGRKKRKIPASWMVYGGFSQFYRRDISFVDHAGESVDQSSLINDLDITGRYRDGRYDIRTRFSGGYDYDFLDRGANDSRITSLYIDGIDKERNISGRLGRQTLSTGGVLGRFDGLRLSYQLDQQTKINFVSGFPVESLTDTHIDTDRYFYGINADLGTYLEVWDFNSFYIKQMVDGIIDREALGGEARYFENERSLLASIDYDIDYARLNLLQLLGNMTLPASKTTFNMLLEYRLSPILTTSNALIGQNSNHVNDLKKIFNSNTIQNLADDRTAGYTTFSLGATQPINPLFQLSGEVTASKLEDTPGSGGVDPADGTGYEFFYDLQLIGNNLFDKNDLSILGLRYSDTDNASTTTLSVDSRFPITPLFRVNPRVLLDYRSLRPNGDQWTLSPSVRLDYEWRRSRHLELDAGAEWSTRNLSNSNEDSSAYFINAGYRIDF